MPPAPMPMPKPVAPAEPVSAPVEDIKPAPIEHEEEEIVEEKVTKAPFVEGGKMAILAEGDAAKRDDILFLEPLPLFTPDGKPL